MTINNQNTTKSKPRSRRRSGELSHFSPVDVTTICYEPDEDLYKHLHSLISVRRDGIEEGADTTSVEIEICYVNRELQIRAQRREAHEAYVKALQDEHAVLEAAVISVTPDESN